MILPVPNRARWSDYSGPLQALIDEYARAMAEWADVLNGVTPQQYIATMSLSDANSPNLQAIGRHVAGAAHSYVDHIEDALGGVDRGRRKHECDCDTPASTIRSAWEGFDRMVVLLSRVRRFTDDDMEKVQFVARWGEHYNMSQMLEHAIVHILRHRRQIERWIRVVSGAHGS
ncbi:MAG: hypothetical protein AB1792_02530 [Candidatus Zixiibacteriota bacterium]